MKPGRKTLAPYGLNACAPAHKNVQLRVRNAPKWHRRVSGVKKGSTGQTEPFQSPQTLVILAMLSSASPKKLPRSVQFKKCSRVLFFPRNTLVMVLYKIFCLPSMPRPHHHDWWFLLIAPRLLISSVKTVNCFHDVLSGTPNRKWGKQCKSTAVTAQSSAQPDAAVKRVFTTWC